MTTTHQPADLPPFAVMPESYGRLPWEGGFVPVQPPQGPR
jgi:hypothetical protein